MGRLTTAEIYGSLAPALISILATGSCFTGMQLYNRSRRYYFVVYALYYGVAHAQPPPPLPYQDARREEGMLHRLYDKYNRNVLLSSFISSSQMTLPSLPPVDASLPVDAPVPLVKKRYARSRHQDTAVINSGPDSIYRFGSVRSSNFDDVLTSEVPGPRTRLANVKLNLLTQTRTAAKDSGLYGPIDSAELQLSNFRVVDVMKVKQADGNLRFVASNNYRKRGPR